MKKKILILLLWLILWQLLAVGIGRPLVLPGPLDVCISLRDMLWEAAFWRSIAGSACHIGAGFLAGCAAAGLVACGCRLIPLLEEFLSPFMAFLKAVPVAAFIVLLLMWTGSGYLSVPVSALMVFPVVFQGIMGGFSDVPEQMEQMGEIYRLRARDRYNLVRRLPLRVHVGSALKVSAGLAWKAGVAAEVIGVTAASIGEQLYMSKIQLEMARVFAWALVIIVLSLLFEKLLSRLCRLLFRPQRVRLPGSRREKRSGKTTPRLILLEEVCKSYGQNRIFDAFSLQLPAGSRTVITGASGRGKTTLLRLIMGVEQPDAGRICFGEGEVTFAPVWQEDRLCEDMSAAGQLPATSEADREEIVAALKEILPEQAIGRPVSELSGGMRRRVSVARAVLSGHDILLLDEPFAGLDDENAVIVRDFLFRHQNGRTMVIVTHRPELFADGAADCFVELSR